MNGSSLFTVLCLSSSEPCLIGRRPFEGGALCLNMRGTPLVPYILKGGNFTGDFCFREGERMRAFFFFSTGHSWWFPTDWCLFWSHVAKGVSANVYSLHIQIWRPDAHSQDNFSVVQFSCQKQKVYSQRESCFLCKCRKIHAHQASFRIVAF